MEPHESDTRYQQQWLILIINQVVSSKYLLRWSNSIIVTRVLQTIMAARSTAVVLNFLTSAPTKITQYCFSTPSLDGATINDFSGFILFYKSYKLNFSTRANIRGYLSPVKHGFIFYHYYQQSLF